MVAESTNNADTDLGTSESIELITESTSESITVDDSSLVFVFASITSFDKIDESTESTSTDFVKVIELGFLGVSSDTVCRLSEELSVVTFDEILVVVETTELLRLAVLTIVGCISDGGCVINNG